MCGVDTSFGMMRIEANVGVTLIVGEYDDDVGTGRLRAGGRLDPPRLEDRDGTRQQQQGHTVHGWMYSWHSGMWTSSLGIGGDVRPLYL